VNAEIIIVDDYSQDDTLKYLMGLDAQIKVIKNSKNLGFAATVNLGVSTSKADIVVLINTDVRPDADCLLNCLKSFESKDVFAVTFNSDLSWAGGRWRDGLFEHYRVSATASNQNQYNPSLWASGGQAAFDRRKWEALGGMDTMYAPFYWEDVDLGYRAWKRGWRIVWDPRCQVVHDHEVSVIRGSFTQAKIASTAQRNQLLFIWKNITDRDLLMSHLKHLPRFIKNYPFAFLAALIRLPMALRGRGVEQRAPHYSDQEVLANWK
jgi:GT2 family glycosyltransferase